jgi:putative heme-binding domain-containing protein
MMLARVSWCVAVGLMTVSAFALGSAPAAGALQLHAGEYSPADIQHGSRLFAAHCASCHGPAGDAIAGANLRSGQVRRASSDTDVGRLIVAGIPEAGMPAHKFSSPEVTALVAYIRNMRDFDDRSMPPGDPAGGKAVFEGKGACLTCHSVGGNGRRVAPDLTAIANVRSAGSLERTLLDPTASMLPHNRSIRAVTKAGDVVSGRRLNEDTYTVQLIDEQERLVSLDKADLREYEVLKTSRMPSYQAVLTAQELADLIAYLMTLKGLSG